jgi:hypothetical protein
LAEHVEAQKGQPRGLKGLRVRSPLPPRQRWHVPKQFPGFDYIERELSATEHFVLAHPAFKQHEDDMRSCRRSVEDLATPEPDLGYPPREPPSILRRKRS